MIKETKIGMAKNSNSIDYFKLPFEVYYSDLVEVTTYEFKSDIDVTSFYDVKAVHMEQGCASGVSFFCNKNNGPELYCCLFNQHDEVEPSWLSFEEEENIKFNHGCDYSVIIDDEEIEFAELSDEESEDYLDTDGMDYCCSYSFRAYHIGNVSPDYIILDAHGSKIKIDLEGYLLDADENRIESQRVINVDEIDHEKYEDFETREFFDAKFAWVKDVLEKDFPDDKNLSLSWDEN